MYHDSLQQLLVLAEKSRPLGPGRLGNVLEGQVPPNVAYPPEDGGLFQNELDELPGRIDRPAGVVQYGPAVVVPHQEGAAASGGLGAYQELYNVQAALSAGQVQYGLAEAVAGVHGAVRVVAGVFLGGDLLEGDQVPSTDGRLQLKVLVGFHPIGGRFEKDNVVVGIAG